MDKCNDISLSHAVEELDLGPNPDYDYASDDDYVYYSIHSIAARAAINNIDEFVSSFPVGMPNLQMNALYSYLKSFTFLENPIAKLKTIRASAMNNAYICKEWDTIKCFLRLLSAEGYPSRIEEKCDRYCMCCVGTEVTKMVFDKFTIKQTDFYDGESDMPEVDYSITVDYSELQLILSGDVETNPGPHSDFDGPVESKAQAKAIKKMQKELDRLRAIQRIQKHQVQRAIELEKRDRQKKREFAADKKRFAQGETATATQTIGEAVTKLKDDVVTTVQSPAAMAEVAKTAAYVAANAVVPGVGTAAAAVVNGSKVTRAIDKLNPTIDMLQGILKSLCDAGEQLKELFKVPAETDIVGVLISLCSIANCLIKKQMFMLALSCANLARLLGVSVDTLMGLIPNVSGDSVEFKQEGKPVAQTLLTDLIGTAVKSTDLLPFAGFFSFLCGAFCLMCTGTVPSPVEMTKHFSNVGRAAQGFRALKEMFAWVMDYLAEIYYTTVYGMSVEEYRFVQNFPNLENLWSAIKLVETFQKTLIDSSAAVADQVLTIQHQLNEYLVQATRSNSRSNATMIQALIKRISDQVSWATHSPARCHSVRVQPVSMYLYGHPGVGKSVATEVLKAKIYKEYLSDSGLSYDSCSFPRRAKNEYWEGYTGQPIVILDDFGNVKDSQQKPVEEYEELEYMVNTAQYPLKMAELKSKGVSNFVSEFIIASSNQRYPDIKSLVDPGAVFRRFHVWAEVTIDPRYGVPIGKDAQGASYYTFSKAKVAETLGIDQKDVSPLYTDHYRFNCYKVLHNKQDGNPEVVQLPGKHNLNFDEFWEFFKQENNRRKSEGADLARAIRSMAGIETPETPVSEKDILEKFDRIFHPEKFLKTLADEDSFPVELPETKQFQDTEMDSFFGSITAHLNVRERLKVLTEQFNSRKQQCSSMLTRFVDKLCSVGSSIKGALVPIAEFILSIMSSLASKTLDYLPSVPTSSLIAGACATGCALLGIWYTGLFCGVATNGPDTWCRFCQMPGDNDVPCTRCAACKIIQFPRKGDMLQHFLERTGIKSVRKDLYALGINREKLEELREEVRVATVPAAAQSITSPCKFRALRDSQIEVKDVNTAKMILGSQCWYGCSLCCNFEVVYDHNDEDEIIKAAQDMINYWGPVYQKRITPDQLQEAYDSTSCVVPLAQRVYENQPRVGQVRNYAQRVYNTQPTVPKAKAYSQGRDAVVNLKTETHIGARVYAQRDQVRVEQTTQVLLNNSVWVQAVDSTGMCSRSNGVFLVGRTMITTAHTIINPPGLAPLTHIIVQNPYSVEPSSQVPIGDCKISQAFQMDGSPVDLVLVSFPATVPNRPKILSKFLDAQSIGLLTEGQMTFSGFHKQGDKTIVQEKYPSYFEVSEKPTQYFLHPEGTCPKAKDCECPIVIGNHITYDLDTYGGMCGALLAVENRMIHTKLIGFHVAGGPGAMAIGVLTTRQFLEANLQAHIEKFNIPKTYIIDGRLPYSQSWVDTTHQSSLLQLGDCINVGSAPSPSAPVKTQLGPSLIFDMVQPHITKPANLLPVMVEGEGLVDPMVKGIKKIMGPQTYIDPDLLEAAANDVFQGLGAPENGKGITHSYEEAICGVEGDPYKRPINRTTSPGYPYNLDNKMKGKTAWLGTGVEYVTDNADLRRDVDELITKAKQGVRGDAISLATLKDEKRPIAKVDQGKTRVFEACPQHLVIAIRQYYLDFAAHVMRHRIKNGIAVGINPYSREWTVLAHHLQSKGDYMIAGDFSNFDGSLMMQVLVKIMEKINEWYDDDEESQLARATLWEHICNADILVRGEVIRKTHSQPSGNPMTVIINSLFNGIVMRVAYMLMKKEQGMAPVCDYREHVAEIIYGDDDIKSVSSNITSWFNQLTLTRVLATMGLTYTDETKTGIITPFKSLREVAFLKRKFVMQDDGMFLAPMDIENVLEITNWIRGKARVAATKENCEQAVMELALHPKSVYDMWSQRIRRALAQVGITMRVPTFFEQRALYAANSEAYSRVEYVPLW